MEGERKEKRLEEFALIRYLTATGNRPPGKSDGVIVGIGDDAAVLSFTPGMDVVACCDAMVESVHFTRKTMLPYDIGYKALASNISDVAAMGGIPRFLLVTLAVSPSWTDDLLQEIYRGIKELAGHFAMYLVGGDTVSTAGPLTLSITVLGEVERGRALTRAGACPGDRVFVSGPLGTSAAGLDYLLHHEEEILAQPTKWANPLVAAHRRPVPQVQCGRLFAELGFVHALNDISDGLAGETWEIAESSGVKIVLEEAALPILEEVKNYAQQRKQSVLDWVLFGGEDYQLVGTAPAAQMAELKKCMAQKGLPLYEVGSVEPGNPGVELIGAEGIRRPVVKKSYNHFT